MKTTTVPAQVTTIEDKIAGNLSLLQVFLLAAPVLITGLMFIIFPPFMKFSIYKFVISGLLLIVFWILSLRIRGKVLLNWLVVIVHYNLRPKYYIFNKNDVYLREDQAATNLSSIKTKDSKVRFIAKKASIKRLTITERDHLEKLMAARGASLSFMTTRRGGLSVRITEIEQEN